MNAIHLILILVLSLPIIALAEQKNPGDENRVKRGLKAEQLQAIQAIGRSVLAAKHSQKKDPELKQLRQRVRDLRKAVKELHHLTFYVEKGGSIMDQSDPRAKRSQTAAKPRSHLKRQIAEAKLGSKLDKLRNHRESVESKNLKAFGVRSRKLIANALAKCKELENQAEEILGSSPSEQPAKLKALLAQMTPSNLGSKFRPQDATPTVSIWTKHRE